MVSRPLGRQTNNFAEYTAVLLALERALELGAREVELVLDSKLAVEQLMGRWRVREATLAPLHARASQLLRQFDHWSLRHEPRAANRAADALANLALDDPAAARRVEQGAAEIEPETPKYWICRTCGVQYPASLEPPAACPICEDERQYVGWDGQQWTTMAELAAAGHRNSLREEEPNLFSIATEPPIAIGQQALLVRTPAGNVLWDCITFIDEPTTEAVRELGGIAAIAISHPHFHDSMTTWSAAFGDCPVYIHAADEEWIQFPGPGLRLWQGSALEILPGVTLINVGGHFPGSAVLHWASGSDGRGVLLTGDSRWTGISVRSMSFVATLPMQVSQRVP